MPRPCESCRHPKADEINRRIKQGRTLDDISRWLKSEGDEFYLSIAALGRHRKHVEHGAYVQPRGQRPYSEAPLDTIIEKGMERIVSGESVVSVQNVISAVQTKENIKSRGEFANLARLAMMALTGQIVPDAIEGEYTELPDEDEQELQRLLTAGG